jgi:hypothetical protein
MTAPHSTAFRAVRDRIVGLDERERARLGRLFGAMQEPQGALGPAVRAALRAIAELDDDVRALVRAARQPMGTTTTRRAATAAAIRVL